MILGQTSLSSLSSGRERFQVIGNNQIIFFFSPKLKAKTIRVASRRSKALHGDEAIHGDEALHGDEAIQQRKMGIQHSIMQSKFSLHPLP